MKLRQFIPLLIPFLFSIACFAQSPWSGILAPSRASDWTKAGIVGGGGIPSGGWGKCGSTIAAYGSSGSYASPSTIINAITACNGSGEYVLLGAGDFYLNAAIRNVGVSNVELRGSGPTQTRLHFSSGSTCQAGNGTCLVGFESSDGTYAAGVGSNFYSWTGGYSQNATSLTISSGTNIVANSTMLMLDQCDTGFSGSPCSGSAVDNGNFFECSAAYNPSGPTGCSFNGFGNVGQRAHRGQIEMVQVTSCSPACGTNASTVVTITPGLHHANWASGQTPQVWLVQPSQYVGVKNLTIDGSATSYSSTTAGLSFNNDANFWAQNVALLSLPNITLYVIQSMHGDVESNYIYNSGQSSPSTDNSGINWYGADNLITNNICHNCHLAIIGGTGNAGNVISYNYLINGYTGNGTLFGDLWPGHSNGADYNLYEGNAAHMYDTDQTHGGQMMNTLYRNFLTGWESCSNGNCGTLPASKMADISPAMILSYQRYHNIVNNVLGTPSITTLGYQYVNAEYFFSSSTGYPYNWTSGNQCAPPNCAGGPIPIEPITGTTSMRYGNWDTFHGSTQCNSAEVPSGISVYPNPVPSTCPNSSSYPASFYLSSRPPWWAATIPFPAIGADVSGGNVGQCLGTPNTAGQFALVAATSSSQCAGQGWQAGWAGHVNAIPALAAYLANGGLPDGTGGALPFDANTWYSSSPTAATPVITPSSGIPPQTIAISDSTPSSTIYYTTDGSTPTTSSNVYLTTFPVTVNPTIVKAIATASGFAQSTVASATFSGNPTAATPVFSPNGGNCTYQSPITVTTTSPGCNPYVYWSSVNPPTTSSNNSTTLQCLQTVTIYATVLGCPGYANSAVQPASFTLVGPPSPPTGLSVIVVGP